MEILGKLRQNCGGLRENFEKIVGKFCGECKREKFRKNFRDLGDASKKLGTISKIFEVIYVLNI